MRITVVGTGYVGLVTGTCFADAGNHVICVDCNAGKIDELLRGGMPLYEPGLGEMVTRNRKAGRLEFSTDLATAVKKSLLVFIAVGTPATDGGSADLSAVLGVAAEIGQAMDGYRIVVMKSTVPVGTHRRVSETIASQTGHPFDYVSNPEFLKEGTAIEDFTRPDRVIIGADNPAVVEILRELYGPFMRKSERIMVMSPASAEMTKYAANAMLATRISFMNEIAGLCEHYGADVEQVRRGVGSDSRIGNAFLFAGVGYGGSCFPKDVTALVSMGEAADFPMRIASSVHQVNCAQVERFARRIIDHFDGRWAETTLAIWGLAFKARTDDVRDSPAMTAIRLFIEHGFKIRAHDPEANKTAEAAMENAIETFDDAYQTLHDAAALIVFTDWPEFRTPDFDLIERELAEPVIFDGRNLYDPVLLAKRGFTYKCVGRPSIDPR